MVELKLSDNKDAPYSDELIEIFLVRFEVLKLGRRWD
jgi:hypothetical protein